MKNFKYPPDPEDDDFDEYGVYKGTKDDVAGIFIFLVLIVLIGVIFIGC